jgi:uncharacterized protein (DUF1800 family)
MTRKVPPAAEVALYRLGLGARQGDLRRVASDPRGAVLAELEDRSVLAIPDSRLASSVGVYRALSIKEASRRAERGAAVPTGQDRLIAERTSDLDCPPTGARAGKKDDPGGVCEALALRSSGSAGRRHEPDRLAYVREAQARFEKAQLAEVGVVERLVAFWANHFAVSGIKGYFIQALAGAFEREAIRPHALGRFADMALAATRHPAMLWYLDNRNSVGPRSSTGERSSAGLNENHARELLELHTLGVDGGYEQSDVTALAKAMTGWGVMDNPEQPAFGRFHFAAARHEPGEQVILGRRYRGRRADQGEEALADIARRPATASHVARKLARAFVADDPPAALVERLARTFIGTDGDLRRVSEELLSAEETWSAAAPRYRTPQDFVLAALRLVGGRPDTGLLLKGLESMGQPLWRPPSPEGYPPSGAEWLSPAGHVARFNLASSIAAKRAAEVDAVDLAEATFGETLTDETASALKRAGSREQALTLLMMSPEMQWR